MREWITYLFAVFGVLVLVGTVAMYAMALLDLGTRGKWKWWQWILAGFVLAFIFTVPSADDGCGPWWRSC